MRARYAAWPLSAKIVVWMFAALIVFTIVAFFLQRAIGPTAEEAVLFLA
jgi:hypothetical protein